MQILGKIQWQGEEKKILLKEEENFFKYYSLELIGTYFPNIKETKIIFKEDIDLSKESKIKIIKLVNQKINPKIIHKKEILQIIGKVEKEILIHKETQMLKYYMLNLIGVYSPKIPGETIIFKQDTLENNALTDIKDNIQRNKIAKVEKEKIREFLENNVYYQQARRKKIEKKQPKEVKKGKKEQEIEKVQQKSQKPQNKLGDINIKQEIDMDTRVTDMSNLEQVLQKEQKIPKLQYEDEALKMGIVESDELKNLKDEKGEKQQSHTSRYEAVMVTKQGKVHTLDLENDTQEGNNPLEKNYQVKQNDTVKKGDVQTRLKLGEGTIGIEKGQYGEVEVYHSQRKTIGGKGIEGNKSLDRQLETSHAKNALEGTNIETLKLAQEHQDGYRSVEEGYREVEKHKQKHPDCEPKQAKDLDGDENTNSHVHETEEFVELSSGEKVTYQELASRWGFYKDGKPDSTYVKEKFSEKQQGDKKAEEVIAQLDEEYEDPRTSRHTR